MHIAFFNRSFHPDTSATSQILGDLCEDLVAKHGCRVTVVCGVPLLRTDAEAPLPARELYRGTQIVRTGGTNLSKKRFIGRATNYVSYFLSACRAGLTLQRPDVIVALTDPPIIGLAGWLASRRHRVPLVMSYQDLFPEVAVLLEDFHSDAVNAALQSVNRFLCRKAARVVALGETMRDRLITTKGAPPERTTIIPSGADTHAIMPRPKRNAFSEAHGLADVFVVMHSGNIGLSQNLDTLIGAAALLRDVDGLRIVLQGDGVKRPDLEAKARALDLRHVTFLPYQPKERLAESFAAADVFVVSLQAGLAGYIVPSKLYGILAAGRPYVAAVEPDCEVAAITRRSDCGLLAVPGDARSLADQILAFRADPVMRQRQGANARAAALQFDRSLQSARYFELFQAVCDERRQRRTEPAGKPAAVPSMAPAKDDR
jgi:glycosyltransferase involved in cell wall biosynthesis